MTNPNSEFFKGARATLPVLAGVVPFGMIFGALSIQAHIPNVIAQSMSSVVFAGSAQFVATQLISSSVPALIIIATVTVINLRHMLYSASVAPHIEHLGWRWKLIFAYLLTDETYVVAISHLQDPVGRETDDNRHLYFLGAGLAMWLSWQTSTALGLFVGQAIPASWQLDFALPLTFIALVFPALKDRPALAAAIVAGLVAIIAASLPLKLGLIVAATCGIATGVALERLWPPVTA